MKYHMWLALGKPATYTQRKILSNSFIQSVISREGLKQQICDLLWIYSYLLAIRLLTPQCTTSWISHHFSLFFINTTSTYIGVEGAWGGGGCMGGGGYPWSGGLPKSSAIFKVKWPRIMAHFTKTECHKL